MQNIIYDKPYTRIGPYIIGMMTAYVYVKTNARIQGKARIFAWRVAACTLAPPAIAYSDICPNFQLEGKWSAAANVAYISLSRPIWTLGVAILVYMCMRGDGGIVNSILSWKPWDAMAKLTYAAYLVHPILMRVVLYNRLDVIDFDFSFYIVHFTFFLVAVRNRMPSVLHCGRHRRHSRARDRKAVK